LTTNSTSQLPHSFHTIYDAAGNVTSTTDASGSLSFQYDQLSRITSETKTFTGLSNSFTLNYSYTFTGQLLSVNIPSNTSFNYSYDKIGRLSQVGSTGFEITFPVISNLKYRSWGAVKEMTYGNNMKTTLAYNTKQMPTSYQVTNFTNTTDAVGSTYEYYNDGMLRKVTNLTDNKFDRAYAYDNVGRLKEALSGAEARGGTTADGPYKQIYNYDIWGNNINFSHREWTGGTITDNAPYTNNRRQSFYYDATGQVTGSQDGAHGYDAAARPTTFVSNAFVNNNGNYQPAFEAATTYSGSGIPEKRVTTHRTDYSGTILTTVTPTYFLRSSVLGGQAIAEITEQGVVRKNFIYASGMKVAECTRYTYPTNYWDTVWQHTNPVTGSHFVTGHSGGSYYPWANRQLDPLGADVTEPPDPLQPIEEPSYLNPNKDFFWPLQYEANDITLVGETRSQRDLAMSDWDQGMIAIQDKLRAEDAWKRGDQATWEKILANNPNVGIQEGGRTLWGKEASDFLNDQHDKMLASLLGSPSEPPSGGNIPLPNLEKGLKYLLSNKDCSNFVRKLINKVAQRTNRAAISNDPLALLA
jgi:YD repeat-containing protein